MLKAVIRYGTIRWQVLLIFVTVLATLAIFHSPLALINKLVLIFIVFFVLALHWNLQDGGLLSRLIYKFHGNFELRNWITLGAGYLLCTLILVLTQGFYTPLVSIYYIAIVLTAVRGGVKFSAIYSLILAFSLGIFYYLTLPKGFSFLGFGLLHPILFATIGIISGYVAKELRNLTLGLNALYEIGKSINSSLKTEDIAQLVLSVVFLDLEADFGAIYLVDESNKKQLQLIASRGGQEKLDGGLKVGVEEGIFSWVTKSRKLIRLPDTRRHSTVEFIWDKDIRTLVVAPFLVAEELIGVLVVGKYEPHAFDHQKVRFLEALTGQAATAFENARLYTKTHEHAIKDGLTGVYNYRYFIEQLEEEILRASRYERPVSLIMADVDFFKSINDTYGHLCGDEVLRGIAQLLDSQTREIDLVARYGGEEFVIVLPETDYSEAFQVAIKLQEIMADTSFPDEKGKNPIRVTISLGVASYPSTALSKEELLKQADNLLYEAKTYRNTVCSVFEKKVSPIGKSTLPFSGKE